MTNQRELDYRQNSMLAYAEGRYLDASRWARLAEYERDRAQHLANRTR